MTVKKKFHIPFIDDLLDELQGSYFFYQNLTSDQGITK
jgi:hypothetical protein